MEIILNINQKGEGRNAAVPKEGIFKLKKTLFKELIFTELKYTCYITTERCRGWRGNFIKVI